MEKLAIVYHPYGEKKFTTKDLGDSTYKVVDDIQTKDASVEVYYMEDGGQVKEVYCMQFMYEEWR